MKHVKGRNIVIFIVMVLVAMFLITGCGRSENAIVEFPTSDFYVILFGIFCFALTSITCKNAKDSVQKYKNQYQESQEDIKDKSDEISNLESKYSRKIKQIIREYEDKIKKNAVNFHKEIQNKDSEIENLKSENIRITSELNIVSQNFLRAVTLHPELEKEIHYMIEDEFKEAARRIDQKISDLATKNPDKDLIVEFEEVVSSYNILNPGVAKYVTSDIKPIIALYDQSVKMKREYDKQEKEKKDKKKAVEAQRIMQSLVRIDCETTYEDYSDFSEALLIYESLTKNQRELFPDFQWLENFKEKYAEVQSSHNDYMSAKRAEQKIYNIVERIGRPDENDRDNIKSAMEIYYNLTSTERKYFCHQLYETLKQMKKLAI